jgi:hypothetical protein
MKRSKITRLWFLGAIALLTTMAAARTARAQFYWWLAYDPAVAVGGARQWVPGVSPLGFEAGAEYHFAHKVSVGVLGTWNLFYEKTPESTWIIENGAVTGTLYRHAEVIAVAPEVRYVFHEEGKVLPFASLGAGVAVPTFKILVTDLQFSQRESALFFTPQAGVLIPYDRNGTIRQAALLGLRYSFISTGYRDFSTTSYLALTLGGWIY